MLGPTQSLPVLCSAQPMLSERPPSAPPHQDSPPTHPPTPQHAQGAGQKRRTGGGGGSAANDVAIVRFASALEAHRAVRDRQGGFCGNSQVRLRVLQ